MSQNAQRQNSNAARVTHDPAALQKLLGELAQAGRLGASQSLAGSAEARHWTALENHIGGMADNATTMTTAALQARNTTITHAATQHLRNAVGSPERTEQYTVLMQELSRWQSAWTPLADEAVLARHLHHALLWHTTWHLLAAGVAISRVQRLLGPSQVLHAVPSDKTPQRQTRAQAGTSWSDISRHVTASAAIAGKGVATGTVKGAKTFARWYAKHGAARRQKDAKAARTVCDPIVNIASATTTTPAPVANDHPTLASIDVSRQLDGRGLQRSLFPTWLALVLLSWVSLFWGALISLPVGVGFGILAAAIGGIFIVPLWGTVFGLIGMGSARDATLKEMGFQKLDADSELAKTNAAFARTLGIPAPTIGIMNAFNAFAMGANSADATVALGQPLLEHLSESETEAVLGHELGHVVSGDMRRMMLMRTFQNATVWFMMFQGTKQLARWIICWAAELYILASSRHREYIADAIGASLAGKDAMIGALRKLEQAPVLTAAENTHARFMVRGRAAGMLSTHPSFAQRIHALERETFIRRLPMRPGAG